MADPAQDVKQTTPPGLPQAVLTSLFPQAPAAPTDAAPAMGDDPMTQAATQQMQWGAKEAPAQLDRARAASTALGSVAGENIPETPRASWLDPRFTLGGRKLAPGEHQPGGFLHNLGRALIAIGGATSVGRDIQEAEFGPGQRQWAATYGPQGTRAQTIAALREQAQTEEQPLQALTAGPSRMLAGVGRYEAGKAAIDRVTAQKPLWEAQAKAAVANIDLKRAALDQKTANDAAKVLQAKVDEAGRNFRAQNKDATEEEVAQVLAGSREAIKNAAIAANPSAWQQIQVALGWGETPQIQGGPKVEQTPPAKSTDKTKAKAGGTKPAYRGKDGKWYDATTNKPL